MNLSLRLSLGIATVLAVGSALGQTPASPDNTSAQAAAATEATAEIPVASPTIAPIEPPSIIPPNTLPGPDAASLPQVPAAPELELLSTLFKQSSLGKAADAHRLLVQVAELETGIRNDAGLHALKRAADDAPTDLERRHRLRDYYQAYFQKLRARAATPALRDYLTAQQAIHERTLLQPRVRHETDEAEAARLATQQAAITAAPLPTPVQAKVSDVFKP